MTLSQRAVLTSLAVVLAYAGFGFACPQWTATLGLDVWRYAEYQRDVRQSEQGIAELNDVGLRVRQRLSLKILITHDLISKRISLAQATEQFLELNKVEPETMTPDFHYHPAASDEERVALQVINFARAELRSNPSLRREVVCELEEQLREMRDCEPEERE